MRYWLLSTHPTERRFEHVLCPAPALIAQARTGRSVAQGALANELGCGHVLLPTDHSKLAHLRAHSTSALSATIYGGLHAELRLIGGQRTAINRRATSERTSDSSKLEPQMETGAVDARAVAGD